jgi:transcriptional regulator with XRE-family HTH domain
MREAIGKFIGAQVAAHRHAMRWSQANLAEKVGVSRQAVAQIESGQLPAFETLYSLAAAFNLEPGELLPLRRQVKASA